MHNPYWDLTLQLKNKLHIGTNITGLTVPSFQDTKRDFHYHKYSNGFQKHNFTQTTW